MLDARLRDLQGEFCLLQVSWLYAETLTSGHKYAQISPRKVRSLADFVRGKFVDEALDTLRYQPTLVVLIL